MESRIWSRLIVGKVRGQRWSYKFRVQGRREMMMKLLIVDDEPIEREGMQAILQKAFPELTIYQARNGEVAIELADTIQPDLVLMDIKMPGMTGLEAIRKDSR